MESRYDHWIRCIKLAGINTLFKVNCVEWEDEWIPMKTSRERERATRQGQAQVASVVDKWVMQVILKVKYIISFKLCHLVLI